MSLEGIANLPNTRNIWCQVSCYAQSCPQVAPVLKERMVKKGSMMVGYQPLDSRVNFFRMVILSPLLSHSDLDFFLDELERLGSDL